MSEEELIEQIENYIELLTCDEKVLELPAIFQKEWAENLQALLDLYNILKEKYNFTIKNNLDDKYEEVLEKVMKKYVNKEIISKDRIREEIKELNNMKVEGEVFTTSVNFAKKILQELLEEI